MTITEFEGICDEYGFFCVWSENNQEEVVVWDIDSMSSFYSTILTHLPHLTREEVESAMVARVMGRM